MVIDSFRDSVNLRKGTKKEVSPLLLSNGVAATLPTEPPIRLSPLLPFIYFLRPLRTRSRDWTDLMM